MEPLEQAAGVEPEDAGLGGGGLHVRGEAPQAAGQLGDAGLHLGRGRRAGAEIGDQREPGRIAHSGSDPDLTGRRVGPQDAPLRLVHIDHRGRPINPVRVLPQQELEGQGRYFDTGDQVERRCNHAERRCNHVKHRWCNHRSPGGTSQTAECRQPGPCRLSLSMWTSHRKATPARSRTASPRTATSEPSEGLSLLFSVRHRRRRSCCWARLVSRDCRGWGRLDRRPGRGRAARRRPIARAGTPPARHPPVHRPG